jgi:hypothetical protein
LEQQLFKVQPAIREGTTRRSNRSGSRASQKSNQRPNSRPSTQRF